MKKKHLFGVYLILLLIAACNGVNGATESPAQKKDSTIVVIFQEAPNQASLTNFKRQTLFPQYTAKEHGIDTLSFKPSKSSIPWRISHAYKSFEWVTFPVIPGDTILFQYDSTGYPSVLSLTSPQYTRYYNLIPATPGSRMKNGFSYFSEIQTRLLRFIDHNDKIQVDQNAWSKEEFQPYLSRLNSRIDSLRNGDKTSRQYYDYYRLTVDLNLVIAAYYEQEYQDSHAKFSYLQKQFHPYLDDKNRGISSYASDCLGQIWRFAHDDQNRFYYWVTESDSIPPLSKKTLLQLFLSGLNNNEIPADTLLKYTRLYVEFSGDTLYRKKLAEMEQNPAYTFKDDLQLISLKGDTTLFQDVLKQHAGKVIYVDYWASWCAPCRREMPAAKKLREAYKDKEVVFIYLALNDTPDKWREAVKKEQTDYLGVNYIINNSRKATMIDELKIESIPRFMIYDRSGKQVELNAPRPGTPEVRKLLDKYLVK